MRNLLLLFLLLTFLSCRQKTVSCENDIQQKIFYDGIATESSGPAYVIATITDKNSGLTKELCFEANDLIDAIRQEYPKRSYWKLKKERPCVHHFSFKDSANLVNLGFYKYDTATVDSLVKHFPNSEMSKLKSEIMKRDFKKLWAYTIQYPFYFQHLLIKNGIACERDDESGYTIAYVPK